MKTNNALMFCIGFSMLFSCNSENEEPISPIDDQIEFSRNKEVTDGEGNVYKIGYDQVSSINQDPFIQKTNSSGQTIWRHRYEETPVDGRGTVIAMSGNRLYAVFTVDGGSTDAKYLNKHKVMSGAFSGVFQSGYEKGGGPRVSILCEIDPESGMIKKGAFITARLSNGNTNSLNIKDIGFQDGNVAFRIEAAAWPPGVGKSYVKMPDITDADRINNAFLIYYEMKG
jgi:hypothetical protein